MRKEVRKWLNQVVTAVAVEVAPEVAVKAVAVEKVQVGPPKQATSLDVAAITPRQNASNWQVLIAVFPFAVNTSANKSKVFLPTMRRTSRLHSLTLIPLDCAYDASFQDNWDSTIVPLMPDVKGVQDDYHQFL